ncbi:MAG: hypothetical protein PHC43_06080, partial [Candidatus Marinimicrobia bacterium]|nr:hypothetical protein [Candidatus Neomarinimicrobiota bacterium]
CTKEVRAGLLNGSKKWGLGGIPAEIPELISNSRSREEALNKIKLVFDEFINKPESKKTIAHFVEVAQRNWEAIKEKYFQTLSKMLEISISEFEKQYQAYFTFSQRCPFGSTFFMFNKNADISNTASHEIMHIEFLKKYKNYLKEKGLSDGQIYHFKEILTALLNEDMKEIMYRPDLGYADHQELREKMVKLYQEHKSLNESFLNFLGKAIDVFRTGY